MSERQPYDRGMFTQRNKTEREIRLDPEYDTEEVSKSGNNLSKRRRLFDLGTKVGTSYVDSAIFDARFYKEKLVHIINRDTTNNLLYKWLACVNPTKWIEIQPETTITKNATGDADDYQTNSEPFAFYKLQCKSSAGTVEVEAYMEAHK